MIKLQDLSITEREILLKEARQQIEQENIEKNAVAMYNIKKKELLTNAIEELEKALKVKCTEQKRLKEHVTSLTNYLYKICRKCKNMSTNVFITNEEEWNNYVLVLNNIKTMMIATYKGESLNESEDKI